MDLNENSLIEYTIEDSKGNVLRLSFRLVEIEGSVPSFYEQFKNAIREAVPDFDINSSNIISRRLVGDSNEENI